MRSLRIGGLRVSLWVGSYAMAPIDALKCVSAPKGVGLYRVGLRPNLFKCACCWSKTTR